MRPTVLPGVFCGMLSGAACNRATPDTQPTPAPSAGEVRSFGGVDFAYIPAGRFTMGSPESEENRRRDETQHEVELSSGFWLMTTEVTQEFWLSVMGDNPAEGESHKGYTFEGSAYPVVYVSWCDAVWFANALSERDGLEKAYGLPPGFSASTSWDLCKKQSGSVTWNQSASGYRLPTESEWEWAARAGGSSVYAGTNATPEVCQHGNVSNPSAKEQLGWSWPVFPCEDGHTMLAPVGSFRANGWGLHDMSGNVWEWCWDWHGAYPTDPSIDPLGAHSGSDRIVRGGSWGFSPADLRIANHFWFKPPAEHYDIGVRLVRGL